MSSIQLINARFEAKEEMKATMSVVNIVNRTLSNRAHNNALAMPQTNPFSLLLLWGGGGKHLYWQFVLALAAARFPATAMITPTSIVIEMRKCPNILLRGIKPQLLIDVAGESRPCLFIVDRKLTHSMKRRAREIVVLGGSVQHLLVPDG